MTLMNSELIEQARKYLDIDHLRNIILDTSNIAWDNAVSMDRLDSWISNFSGQALGNADFERRMAYWLLSHFTYYTENDIKVLCKDIYWKFVHDVLFLDFKSKAKPESIETVLRNTRFTGLGNKSESGAHILYYFRQINNLPIECFDVKSDVEYKNLVFIDDVTMSGEQAREYIELLDVKVDRIYFLTLFSSIAAKLKMSEDYTDDFRKPVKMISANILDVRDKAFSKDSYLFSRDEIVPLKFHMKEMCEYYGKKITTGYMNNYPLGFDDGQYMIGFSYNTPDNTLPIFWGTGNNWYPLFERKTKLKSVREYRIDERLYY